MAAAASLDAQSGPDAFLLRKRRALMALGSVMAEPYLCLDRLNHISGVVNLMQDDSAIFNCIRDAEALVRL